MSKRRFRLHVMMDNNGKPLFWYVVRKGPTPTATRRYMNSSVAVAMAATL